MSSPTMMTLCSGGIQGKDKVSANPESHGLGCPQQASCPSAPAWVPSPLPAPLLSRHSLEPNHTDVELSISDFCVVSVSCPPSLHPSGALGNAFPAGWGPYHFTWHRTGPQHLSRNVEERTDPIPSPSTFLEKSDCLRVGTTLDSKSPPQETDLSRGRAAQLGGG